MNSINKRTGKKLPRYCVCRGTIGMPHRGALIPDVKYEIVSWYEPLTSHLNRDLVREMVLGEDAYQYIKVRAIETYPEEVESWWYPVYNFRLLACSINKSINVL